MHQTLRLGIGTAIAVLATGVVVPAATATSYAVEVTTTGSSAVVTDSGANVRFDVSVSVRELGPLTVTVLPRIVTDTPVPQVVVDVMCTPDTLPGAGTYEVTCEGPARWTGGFTEGAYDSTGQLLVESAVTGQVYASTTLLHRLVVQTPVEPKRCTTCAGHRGHSKSVGRFWVVFERGCFR